MNVPFFYSPYFIPLFCEAREARSPEAGNGVRGSQLTSDECEL